MELKEELYNIGLAFVQRQEKECNLTEITKIVKDRCNDMWLLAAVWKLKGVGRNTEKERCPLCLGEEDAKHIHIIGLYGNQKLEIEMF